MARASAASSSNSSGVPKRSSGACLGVGCRYWPMVRKSTSAARRSSITCRISLARLAQPDHQAGLGEHRGIDLLHPLQQPQRGEVARARADRRIEPRHGLEIVVEDVGPRRDHGLDRALLAQEVGRQHLDRRAGRRLRASRAMTAAKCAAPPSSRSSRSTEVTTTWREAELADRLGDVAPARADRARPACRSRRCRRRRRACRCRP